MRLLLDTHIPLWAMQGSKHLSVQARSLMKQADAIYISSASLWEIAIKAAPGRFDVDSAELAAERDSAGFPPLPVEWRHTTTLRTLPPLHKDPFDRMLVAQAISEPLRLLTHGRALVPYSDVVTLV
ncbi:MAG TPA: type II toxin-antitoxin system VapC family toxin [Nevskiaceae bacterium]|nr:type II toxin-antitoxin system VapC family toxin [Nevskiaceae bacterium]